MEQSLLRKLPKVDEVLKAPIILEKCGDTAPHVLKKAVRNEVEAVRSRVLCGEIETIPSLEELAGRICAFVHKVSLPSLCRVINGTGVVLHTNLGRACISKRAIQMVTEVAKGYSNLEYDIASGGRGFRYSHVEHLLTDLTGAESAMVVNNNAAAVLLILSALAAGGEVITSRGELVEIGGAFRVPDIMEGCGCKLREVGTTNKTRLSDYQRAVGENTRALLKVHTSNFKIMGFTESVPRADLVELGRKVGLPVIEDLGSGSFWNLNRFNLKDEPTVQEVVRSGVDVVSFSGDKLLGGPQTGIILGKREYMDILKHHPLARAVRVDKLTLAALEATLHSYADGTAQQEIPTLRMLGESQEKLRAKADMLCGMLLQNGVEAEIIEEVSQVGGGSVPGQVLPTYAVAIHSRKLSSCQLEKALRLWACPIIVRIVRQRCVIDVRTLMEEDFICIAQALKEILK